MTHDNVTDIVERLNNELGWGIGPAMLCQEAAQVITTLRKQLENAREALIQADLTIRSFKGTDQSDVEFIREALKGQPDNKPSGIPVDSPTSIQHDKSGYTP